MNDSDENVRCLNKQHAIKKRFLSLSLDQKYAEIIKIGKTQPLSTELIKSAWTDENQVHGCQSSLHIKVSVNNNYLLIQTGSNALISKGLAALLCSIYQNELPETIFKCPPLVLKEIGLLNYLSPSRANGLKNLYQKLQALTIPLLTQKAPA